MLNASTILILICDLFLAVNGAYFDFGHVAFGKRLGGFIFKNIYPLSLKACWKKCDSRAICASFNYLRTVHECELNTERISDFDNLDTISTKGIGYVYWERETIKNQVLCVSGETCDTTETCDTNTLSCQHDECPVIQPPTNGFIKGNQNAVGSKKLFGCNDGYITSYPVGGLLPVTSECLPNGTWSVVPFNCLEATCKNIIETGHISQTGQYQYVDAETSSYIDIFCDFDHPSGTGYTFFGKGTLANLSNLGSHYSRYDKLIIRHLTTADEQRESVLKVLPIYQATYNISLFLTNHDDFNPPPMSVVGNTYLYIGLIPNSFNSGSRQGTIQGYESNDDIYDFVNCDTNTNNYIVISTEEPTATCICCCDYPVATGFMDSSTTVGSGLNMPTDFYYGSYALGFGGCGTASRSFYTNRIKGLAFGLPFNFNRP